MLSQQYYYDIKQTRDAENHQVFNAELWRHILPPQYQEHFEKLNESVIASYKYLISKRRQNSRQKIIIDRQKRVLKKYDLLGECKLSLTQAQYAEYLKTEAENSESNQNNDNEDRNIHSEDTENDSEDRENDNSDSNHENADIIHDMEERNHDSDIDVENVLQENENLLLSYHDMAENENLLVSRNDMEENDSALVSRNDMEENEINLYSNRIVDSEYESDSDTGTSDHDTGTDTDDENERKAKHETKLIKRRNRRANLKSTNSIMKLLIRNVEKSPDKMHLLNKLVSTMLQRYPSMFVKIKDQWHNEFVKETTREYKRYQDSDEHQATVAFAYLRENISQNKRNVTRIAVCLLYIFVYISHCGSMNIKTF